MIGHERFQHLVDRESGAAGAACGLRETRLHAKIPGTEAALVHSSFLLQELGRARNPRLRHTTSLPDKYIDQGRPPYALAMRKYHLFDPWLLSLD